MHEFPIMQYTLIFLIGNEWSHAIIAQQYILKTSWTCVRLLQISMKDLLSSFVSSCCVVLCSCNGLYYHILWFYGLGFALVMCCFITLVLLKSVFLRTCCDTKTKSIGIYISQVKCSDSESSFSDKMHEIMIIKNLLYTCQ